MNGQLPEGLVLRDLESEVDDFPVPPQFTLGRHLDNDLIVAGEDVRDYHARCALDERGLSIVPLDGAVIEINDHQITESWRLVPNDLLMIGSHVLQLLDRAEQIKEKLSWTVHYKGEEVVLSDQMTIGRGSKAEITFNNNHISREHARLFTSSGLLWLLDLNSANGTFVNGKRLFGGCRLFHGDELSFDQLTMQVIARGGDLTPARRRDRDDLDTDLDPLNSIPTVLDGTQQFVAVAPPDISQKVSPSLAGCYLVGQSEPVVGKVFQVPFGSSTIGREPGAEVVVDEPSVSVRHAEINYRSDILSISNLLSTNGTRVNGKAVATQALKDGDIISVGKVSLVLQLNTQQPTAQSRTPAVYALVVVGVLALCGLGWWFVA